MGRKDTLELLGIFFSQSMLIPCSEFQGGPGKRQQGVEDSSEWMLSITRPPALTTLREQAHTRTRTHTHSSALPFLFIFFPFPSHSYCPVPWSMRTLVRIRNLSEVTRERAPTKTQLIPSDPKGAEERAEPSGWHLFVSRTLLPDQKVTFPLLTVRYSPLQDPGMPTITSTPRGVSSHPASHLGAGTSASAPSHPLSRGACLSFLHAHQPALEIMKCSPGKQNLTSALPASPEAAWELHLCVEHSLCQTLC